MAEPRAGCVWRDGGARLPGAQAACVQGVSLATFDPSRGVRTQTMDEPWSQTEALDDPRKSLNISALLPTAQGQPGAVASTHTGLLALSRLSRVGSYSGQWAGPGHSAGETPRSLLALWVHTANTWLFL